VLAKPHRTGRDPGSEAVVWRGRRRWFAISTVVWLVGGVAGTVGGLGTISVALALVASLLSAVVVGKAQVLVRRTDEGQPSR
jgi:hypothetical protein